MSLSITVIYFTVSVTVMEFSRCRCDLFDILGVKVGGDMQISAALCNPGIFFVIIC